MPNKLCRIFALIFSHKLYNALTFTLLSQFFIHTSLYTLARGGSTSGQQWALPLPQFNGLPPPPSCFAPIFFAQALLPMYNVAMLLTVGNG